MMTLDQKFTALQQLISGSGKAAVAFSGGVDSTLLCRVAYDVLGDNALAVTVVSPMLPKSEFDAARSFTASIGMKQIFIEETEIDDAVAENPADRCYRCKRIEFDAIIRAAKANGISTVFDGSNLDDLNDYRPGTKAISELGVASPLKEAGMTKHDIRELSHRLGLATWDKPAFACLASRVPYGEKITPEKLKRIDRAEDFLRAKGFRQIRVRIHGDIARIETAPDEREKFFDVQLIDEISRELMSYGFLYVCMELSGYRMGNMNRAIDQEASRG
jgi:uncharacterized protein